MATDLFGAWLVDMSYGRIGTIGRSKIRSFATIEDLRNRCALACENARQHRAASASLTTCVASIETKAGGNRGSTIDFAGGFRRQPRQLRQATWLLSSGWLPVTARIFTVAWAEAPIVQTGRGCTWDQHRVAGQHR